MTVAIPDTLEQIRDGAKGTKAYGCSLVNDTANGVVACLAAPGAGYHYEIRRIRAVNKTTAEKTTIRIEDGSGTPVILAYLAAHDPAVTLPDDTGWLNQPIHATSNKGINSVALASVGDTYVMVWADKVAD